MHALEVIRHTNEVAALEHYNRLKWDAKISTLVAPDTGKPVTDRTFASKMQALRWLKERGLDIAVF